MSKSLSLPQIQQALMGLSPQNQERFFLERDEFFEETPFPHELPENFEHWRFFCGCHTNEIQLGITAENFMTLFFTKNIEQYSLGNLVSICQASENVTFFMYISSYGNEQGTVAKWSYFRKSFERLTAQVNAIMEPALMDKLKRITRMQQSLIKANIGDDEAMYQASKNGNSIILPS